MTQNLPGALRGIRTRLHSAGEDDDRGFTMIEVVASMTIFSIFLAIFTASLIQLFGSSNKANAVNDSSSQLNIAVMRLDKEVRYASAIDSPTAANGNYYVEFLTQSTGTSVCTQLRLSAGVLAQRSWTPSPPPATAPTWNALASGVSNTSTPFTFYPSDNSHFNQRLEVALQTQSGNGNALTTSTTDVSFAALNSTPSTSTSVTPTASVCTDQGRP